MSEIELARDFEAIIGAHCDDFVTCLEAIARASRGPTWSRAMFEIALSMFHLAQFAKARELARSVVYASPERRERIASVRAAVLIHNATSWLHEPVDVEGATEATREALVVRLPFDAGVGFETLAAAFVTSDRPASIRCYDAATRCYLESWSGAAASGCLAHLARMAIEDGDRDRARRLVERGLEHARKFVPFATRNVRPALERLRDQLARS